MATIATELEPEEIKARLLKMSKKGKLPGYESDPGDGLAAVAAHGAPFDSKLVLYHEPGGVRFELKMLPLFPAIFVAVLVVTIWPGLPLTDGFLRSFQWYEHFVGHTGIKTWYWYLPMTVLPAPFAVKGSIKKARASAEVSALETIEKLRTVLSIS